MISADFADGTDLGAAKDIARARPVTQFHHENTKVRKHETQTRHRHALMGTFLQRILGGFAAACLAIVIGALTYAERGGTTVDVHASVGIPLDNADADARFLLHALQGAGDELNPVAITRAVDFVATCQNNPTDRASAPLTGSHRIETEPR